jgi:hypothetical protein
MGRAISAVHCADAVDEIHRRCDLTLSPAAIIIGDMWIDKAFWTAVILISLGTFALESYWLWQAMPAR